MNKCRVALLCALLAPAGAMAAGDVDLNIGGFIWGQVGFGDRYDGPDGDDDQLGVSKAALTVSPEYMNTRGVVVLGVDDLFNEEHFSNGNAGSNQGNNDGDIQMKEAFIGIKFDVAGGELDVTLGKQPLLFGLKPNGWVGDRPIQDGLEFGGADGLNVSGQVQTALIANWTFGSDAGGSSASSLGADGTWSFRLGLFDTDEYLGGGAQNGSTVTDNWIIQARGDNFFGTGLYGSLGYERLFQENVNSEEGLISVGIGWSAGDLWQNGGGVDVSLEYQDIDSAIAQTPNNKDETQLIAEVSVDVMTGLIGYLEYATADELDADTIRLGAIWTYNDHVDFMAEYAKDKFSSASGQPDDDSFDLRAAFSF